MIKSHKKIDEKIEFSPQRTGIYKIESEWKFQNGKYNNMKLNNDWI